MAGGTANGIKCKVSSQFKFNVSTVEYFTIPFCVVNGQNPVDGLPLMAFCDRIAVCVQKGCCNNRSSDHNLA